jgi:hypothetical protein
VGHAHAQLWESWESLAIFQVTCGLFGFSSRVSIIFTDFLTQLLDVDGTEGQTFWTNSGRHTGM